MLLLLLLLLPLPPPLQPPPPRRLQLWTEKGASANERGISFDFEPAAAVR
jgi:hypothetical protein